MSERDPVDTIAPWTIKSMSVRTRETVIAAARREGLTVGQWLERRVADWEAVGSPVPVSNVVQQPGHASDVGALADLMRATLAVAQASDLPGMKGIAQGASALVRAGIRDARGMPSLAPRRKPLVLTEE